MSPANVLLIFLTSHPCIGCWWKADYTGYFVKHGDCRDEESLLSRSLESSKGHYH